MTWSISKIFYFSLKKSVIISIQILINNLFKVNQKKKIKKISGEKWPRQLICCLMVILKVRNSYLLLFVKFMIWASKFLNSTIVVKCEIRAVQIKDSTIVKFVILAPRSSDSTIVESVVSHLDSLGVKAFFGISV